MFDGIFDHYEKPKGSRVIELPEDVVKTKSLEYPRVMLVSEHSKDWKKRVVFMEKNGKFIPWSAVETLEKAETVLSTVCWEYAKEIEEEKERSN